jgi:type II secretory pathway pseudopilin PulG
MKKQCGLILFELIAVIVLVGIIATFIGFFLYTGLNGYLKTRKNSDGAFNAQMAMNRITLELRDIYEIHGSPTSPDTSITYKSEKLTGTRTLSYVDADHQIKLKVNDSPAYPLLEDVTALNLLSYNYMNLDGDTAPSPTQEVAHIDVEFTLVDIGETFKTKVFPRNMIEKTW